MAVFRPKVAVTSAESYSTYKADCTPAIVAPPIENVCDANHDRHTYYILIFEKFPGVEFLRAALNSR